ncbi:hypothetical protein [Vibrio coralliilyticus]|uniref:hypothetical protein n=1 Tax=Vibrio coralliilyticus TaxID=190893 RepID=UPI000C172BC5|nr:hypothetical protein [Vibrio coralliilyticus]
MKIQISKRNKNAACLLVAFLLVAWVVYDYATEPSYQAPSTIEDELDSELYGSSSEQNAELDIEPVPDVVVLEPSEKKGGVPKPPVSQEGKFKEALTGSVEEAKFVLSEEGMKILESLESQYADEVKTAAIDAQIKKTEAQARLDSLVEPPVTIEPSVTERNHFPLIDRIQVESIVISRSGSKAWIGVDGNSFPVTEDVLLDEGVRVKRIYRDSILFQNHEFKEFRKFVQRLPSGANNASDDG